MLLGKWKIYYYKMKSSSALSCPSLPMFTYRYKSLSMLCFSLNSSSLGYLNGSKTRIVDWQNSIHFIYRKRICPFCLFFSVLIILKSFDKVYPMHLKKRQIWYLILNIIFSVVIVRMCFWTTKTKLIYLHVPWSLLDKTLVW